MNNTLFIKARESFQKEKRGENFDKVKVEMTPHPSLTELLRTKNSELFQFLYNPPLDPVQSYVTL